MVNNTPAANRPRILGLSATLAFKNNKDAGAVSIPALLDHVQSTFGAAIVSAPDQEVQNTSGSSGKVNEVYVAYASLHQTQTNPGPLGEKRAHKEAGRKLSGSH